MSALNENDKKRIQNLIFSSLFMSPEQKEKERIEREEKIKEVNKIRRQKEIQMRKNWKSLTEEEQISCYMIIFDERISPKEIDPMFDTYSQEEQKERIERAFLEFKLKYAKFESRIYGDELVIEHMNQLIKKNEQKKQVVNNLKTKKMQKRKVVEVIDLGNDEVELVFEKSN
jgi:hypothetical protein